MINFTLGCDPEFFIEDSSGKFIPAGDTGLITGDKYNPTPLNKGTMQVDGLAVEFGITPARSLNEWVDNIDLVTTQIKELLATGGYILSEKVNKKFSQEEWDSVKDEYKLIGCEPSYDILDNMRPINFSHLLNNERTRCCGGHIHIGWTQGKNMWDLAHINDCKIVSNMVTTLLSRIFYGAMDDGFRNTLADGSVRGNVRVKPYGVEVRFLDNRWVFNYKKVIYEVVEAVFKTLSMFSKKQNYEIFSMYGHVNSSQYLVDVLRKWQYNL